MNINPQTVFVVLIAATLLLIAAMHLVRRWDRRLIAQANRKLRLPVPEFQYTNRRLLIDRLLEEESLKLRIDQQIATTGCSANELRQRCRHYAEEIVPAFSAIFYFRVGYWMARTLLLSLYRVHVRTQDDDALDAIKPGSSVVLMMNHRSNMDVLLVNYLASRRSTLINTAGEWARMWPLYHFVHLAGNCVTDRDAEDILYKQLFKSFIQMAVRDRCNIGVFPEGELPRDGKMQRPKFGLFSYVVTADPPHAESLYIIPVAINYDRIPEESQLVAQPDATYRRQGKLRVFGSVFVATVVFAVRALLPLKAQLGNACASFGRPVSLREWQNQRNVDTAEHANRREWVSTLGEEMFQNVASLVPVMPSHAIAILLLANPERSWSPQVINDEACRMMQEVRDRGGVVCVTGDDEQTEVSEALDQLSRRNLVLRNSQGLLTANTDQLPRLRFLANSVRHVVEVD